MHFSFVTWQIAGQCLCFLLLALGLLYVLGALLLRLAGRRIDSWMHLFLALLTGQVAVASVYALARTHGQTVLLLCPLLLAGFLYALNKEARPSAPSSVPARPLVLPLLLMALVSFAAFLLNFLSLHPDELRFLGTDQLCYSNLATYLNATGLENNSPEFIHMNRLTVNPYHYGDMWWIALLGFLTRLKSTMVLPLIAYPSFAVIACSGIAAITENLYPRLRINGWRALLLPVVLLVASGFTFLYPSFIVNWARYDNSFFNVPKLLSPAILVISIAVCYYRKAYLATVLMAAVSNIFYMPLLAISPAVGLLVILACWKKELNIRQAIGYCLLLAAGFIYPFLFYKVFSLAPQDDLYTITPLPYSMLYIRRAVLGLPVANIIQLSCYLVQAAFIFLLYRHYRRQAGHTASREGGGRLLRFVLVLLITGQLFMIASYNQTWDFYQLYTLFLVPVMNIGFAVMYLIAFSSRTSRVLQAVAGVLLLVNLGYSHLRPTPVRGNDRRSADRSGYGQLLHFIPESQPRFADLRPTNEPMGTLSANTVIYLRLPLLAYHFAPYTNLTVNTPTFPIMQQDIRENYFARGYVNAAPFTAYYVKHGGTPERLTELQVAFLKEYRIGYLMMDMQVEPPPGLKRYLSDSLVVPGEGLRLYRLRL